MKKLLIGILCIILLLSLLPVTALAEDTTPVDGYNDHDYNTIRAFLETGGNGAALNSAYDADDPSTWAGVTWIWVGVEKRLYHLAWANTGISGSLDVSDCTALEFLSCGQNALTALDVSGCSALQHLYYGENALATLDITGCSALIHLDCANTGRTTLDVSAFPALVELDCSNNALTSLDVSGLASLEYLDCSYNTLSALDVSGLAMLESVNCNASGLTSLALSGCTSLRNLNCSENALTSLDASGLTSLEYLDCNDNSLTSLSVTGCTNLLGLYCNDNSLTSLSVAGCTNLLELYCNDNSLTSLNVAGCTNLLELYCYNNSLTSLSIADCINLEQLYCSNNSLTSLDVSGNTLLQGLNCVVNELTSLDLSANTGIQYVDAFNNKLTHILASISGNSVELTAGPGGYVGLSYDSDRQYYAVASPSISFLNWTNASDEEVSTSVRTDLTRGVSYDLTANFLYITGDPANGQIYTGGRITLTPSATSEEFQWIFDETALSRSGNQFTGLTAGTTRVYYGNQDTAAYFDVVVRESELPQTGQDYMLLYAFAGGGVLCIAGVALAKKRRGRA